MVYEIAGQNISHGMGEESLAASSAMIVSGLEKEIKPDRVNLMTEDPKIDMKQAEEFIQKLVNSTAIERIKKYEGNESRNKDKKEEEAAKKKKELKAKEKLIEPFAWTQKSHSQGKGIFSFFFRMENKVLQGVLRVVLQPEIEELIEGS